MPFKVTSPTARKWGRKRHSKKQVQNQSRPKVSNFCKMKKYPLYPKGDKLWSGCVGVCVCVMEPAYFSWLMMLNWQEIQQTEADDLLFSTPKNWHYSKLNEIHAQSLHQNGHYTLKSPPWLRWLHFPSCSSELTRMLNTMFISQVHTPNLLCCFCPFVKFYKWNYSMQSLLWLTLIDGVFEIPL